MKIEDIASVTSGGTPNRSEPKLLYSQALYELYYEDYEIRLQTFLDEQALLDEE